MTGRIDARGPVPGSSRARVVPTIIVTGPVGAGKTTVVDEMGLLLLDAGIAHATVDFD